MCYICEIDSEVPREGGSITLSADTAFADQFKCELRDLARGDFDRWLKQHDIGVVLSQEQLEVYDMLFLLGARCALRLLNHHELLLLLSERDAMRGEEL